MHDYLKHVNFLQSQTVSSEIIKNVFSFILTPAINHTILTGSPQHVPRKSISLSLYALPFMVQSLGGLFIKVIFHKKEQNCMNL
jgi:hypothetical protein